ncbi:helix-turn-helix domain-containing protein [Mycolicibacterium sp. 018/SC-01/001]|uniref:helix-turn-helix domain-containing protein n=1 Tax=Mycolicibacterium sp. 018/SC-01/001 TaxID=2592069 RepID=UPI00117E0F0F|nr:helix-turn-helix domain-containing protein [Mycolicibacterium sp. 018/SC-01/001]TRW88265.1 helix-turn-helix domain-containing protein [Mycolicibacterium sp. 018/SC-01/001]
MTPTADTQTTPTLDELRSGPATISVEEAARFLGVSRAYAYVMVREGHLPVIRLGTKRVRVPSAALARLLGVEL